jgi:hypothetical protein
MIFLTHFFIKFNSKLFLKNFYLLFLEKYQHLYKTLLAQSLPFVGFNHRLKYLYNLQSHPVYRVFI